MTNSPIERLQHYTLEHQRITITLATATVGALAYDAVDKDIFFGDGATTLFRFAVASFALSGLCGGFVSAKLATVSDPPPASFLTDEHPLVRLWGLAIPPMKFAMWRTAQHWSLWAGILLAAIAGVIVSPATE